MAADAIKDAIEIMEDLASELHHQVHVRGCRCGLAIRKLQHASGYLRQIHWAGMNPGACQRKDSGVDVTTETCGKTTITHMAVASHYGNITCPTCRKAAWRAGVR